MTPISSETVGCRFAVGLMDFVGSAPRLPELARRKENLRCLGRGDIGCRRNSGGISRREGFGRAIARARTVAASIDRGICDMFNEIKSAFYKSEEETNRCHHMYETC